MNKLRTTVFLVMVFVIGAAFPVFAQEATPEATEEGMTSSVPDSIVVNLLGLFPEGIEWDAAGSRFLLSSLTGQGINAVADDGTVTPFATAENGLSAVGIHIDEASNLLLVDYSDASVFGNPDAMGTAALGIYDLATADLIHYVDLGALYEGKHFA